MNLYKTLAAIGLVVWFAHWAGQSEIDAQQKTLAEFEKAAAVLPEPAKRCFEKAAHDHKEQWTDIYYSLQAHAHGRSPDYDTMRGLVDDEMTMIYQQCRPSVSDETIQAYLDGVKLKADCAAGHHCPGLVEGGTK